MFTAGFVLFLFIFVMAFWMLLFLTAFALPYAITVYVINLFKPSTEEAEESAPAEEA